MLLVWFFSLTTVCEHPTGAQLIEEKLLPMEGTRTLTKALGHRHDGAAQSGHRGPHHGDHYRARMICR
jgi:hypothetical protein